jgi:hypothetical protein
MSFQDYLSRIPMGREKVLCSWSGNNVQLDIKLGIFIQQDNQIKSNHLRQLLGSRNQLCNQFSLEGLSKSFQVDTERIRWHSPAQLWFHMCLQGSYIRHHFGNRNAEGIQRET